MLHLLASRDARESLVVLGQTPLLWLVARRLLSSAMRSSDDGDWPVHSVMMPFHDLRGLSLRRPPSTVPRTIDLLCLQTWPNHINLLRLTVETSETCERCQAKQAEERQSIWDPVAVETARTKLSSVKLFCWLSESQITERTYSYYFPFSDRLRFENIKQLSIIRLLICKIITDLKFIYWQVIQINIRLGIPVYLGDLWK